MRYKTNNPEFTIELDVFRRCFNNAGMFMVALDRNAKILYINKRLCEAMGYSEKEMIGKDWFSFLPGNDGTRNKIRKIFREVMLMGFSKYAYHENSVMMKNGKTLEIGWNNVIMQGRDGSIIGSVSAGVDLEWKKKLEQKLSESEVRYQAIFETANEAIQIMDGMKFIQCNEKTTELFGTGKENILGKTPLDFSPVKQPDGTLSEFKAKMYIKKALRGLPQRFEWTGRKYNGELFEAEICLNSFMSGDKRLLQGILRDTSERKKNEARMQLAEMRYNLLAENINDNIWILDRNFRYSYISPSVTKQRGYEPSDFIGKSVFESIDGESVPHIRKLIRSVVPLALKNSNFKLPPFEVKVNKKDGTIIPVEVSISQMRDKKNKLSGYVGVSRDISERKKLQQKLESSEKYFRAIIEQSSDFIGVFDRNGVIRYTSPSFTKKMGYGPEELAGRKFSVIMAPEDRKAGVEAFNAVASGKKMPEKERNYLFMKKDGSYLPVSTVSRNMLSDPDVAGIVSISRDISERVKAEEMMRNSEKYYRAMIEGQSDVVVIYDGNFRIKYASPSYESLTGIRPENAIGKNAGFAVQGRKEAGEIRSKLMKIADGSIKAFEAGITFISGKRNIVRVTGTNMLADPAIEGILCNITVITEIKESERKLSLIVRELQRVNEDLEYFSYASYHDLQEPLRNISLSIQYMESLLNGKINDDTKFYLHEAVEGAIRMKEMLSDILKYTVAGSSKEAKEVFNMKILVDEVKENMRPIINMKKAAIRCHNLPQVKGVKTQLLQVMQNLISNAIKYGRTAGPRVDIYAAKTAKEWVFRVKDNGIGIENKYLEKIFVMFERLHSRNVYPGTGLGLALCKKIIERHNGRIWAESKYGKGSTFCFTLPHDR